MHKTTYDKKKRELLLGNNFALTKLAALEMEVMGYITMAVTQYHKDGNVDHAKAGGVLLEGFNSKWTRTFFKAIRRVRALHTDFKIVVTPEAIAFTYTPISKDKRPDELPELQVVIDEMLSEFLATKRSREGKTDQEKEESAIKGLLTSLMKSGRFASACDRASVEELTMLYRVVGEKLLVRGGVSNTASDTTPEAPAAPEAPADERNTGTHAVPASSVALEKLAVEMTQ